MSFALFDTHFHLDSQDCLEEIALQAKEKKVFYLNLISCSLEESKKNLEKSQKHSNVSVSIGIHPLTINENLKIQTSDFLPLTKNKKVVAIGEIGLDYHYKQSNKLYQQKVFAEFLKLSVQTKLPAIIHSRDSFEDIYKIVKKELYPHQIPFIMHCFTGDDYWAKKFIEIGAYISYSGIITFNSAKEIQNSLTSVPLDKILIETDSPYLAPVPFRGKKNSPKLIEYTFNKLVKILNIDKLKLSSILLKNSFKVFNSYEYSKS